jgi:hypothetical protein
MGTKRYSLRSLGEAGKIEKGRVRRLWEILELREVSEAVDDLPPTLPGWVRVSGTPHFKTKREAETALKRLQNEAE